MAVVMCLALVAGLLMLAAIVLLIAMALSCALEDDEQSADCMTKGLCFGCGYGPEKPHGQGICV